MRSILFVLSVASFSVAAHASSYDESINGDLSNDHLAPTLLSLSAGSNVVKGTFGQSAVPDVPDRDYLTVFVPVGFKMDRVVLLDLLPGGSASFIGMQAGNEITMAPTSTDPSLLLGYSLMYKSQIGTDLLPGMSISGPLSAGSYSLWIQETDTSAVYRYALGIEVSAVPEPRAALLAAAGLALVAARRVRRRQS